MTHLKDVLSKYTTWDLPYHTPLTVGPYGENLYVLNM